MYQCPLPASIRALVLFVLSRLYIWFRERKILQIHFLAAIFLRLLHTVSLIFLRPAVSIQTTRIASMEQIADLYAIENTAEATASTTRTTGSRNSNVGILA